MNHKLKLAIIGGAGKSGKYLVQQLLREGYTLKLLLRNPDTFHIENPLIEKIQGDVRNYESVLTLLQGCDAVVSTLGQPKGEPTIFSQATRNVIQAMSSIGMKRYILSTGLNVDTPFDKKGMKTKMATDWMKDNYPVTTADKQVEYELLTQCNIDWTLVRLPMIELTDERRNMIVSLEDCPGENISATDLANFLIQQLSDVTFVNKAPFIANN